LCVLNVENFMLFFRLSFVINIENFMLLFRVSLVPNTKISYYESIMVSIYSARELWLFVCLMVFNATLNNTSVIPWRPVLLVEETGYTRKKLPTCRMSLTNFITLCCIEYTSPWTGFESPTLVVLGRWLVNQTTTLVVLGRWLVNPTTVRSWLRWPLQDLHTRGLRPHKMCYTCYVDSSVIIEMLSELWTSGCRTTI